MSDVLGILDLAQKIVVHRRFRGVDTIEIDLDDRAVADAAQLVIPNVLYLPLLDADAPLAFLIEQKAEEDDAEKRDNTIGGRTLDGIALVERAAWPDPLNYPADTLGYDEQTSVPAETAIKHYVNANAAATADADRVVPGFVVATDAARGSTVSFAARYDLLLAVVLELCFKSDLGWKTTFESGTGLHTFEIVEPTDRSSSVFFDFEFDTLERIERVESRIGSKNVAIVAGQGELTARDIEIRGTATGLDRREAFVEAREIALGSTTLLQQKGDAFLAEHMPTKSIVATPRQFGSFQYTRDFHLGDYVLVRDAERDEAFSAQIIEVIITVNKSASVPDVQCVLDRPMPQLLNRNSGSGSTADHPTGGGGAPSGAAGGDLTGTYPDPTVANNKITYAQMQNVSATQRVLARNTAGAGDPEEATILQVLNWLMTTRGDTITRDASNPVRKALGAANTFFESDGTDVQWRTRKGFEAHATAQAIANSADDAIEWTEDRDTDAFHSGTSAEIVIPAGLAGWYAITASIEFSTGGSSRGLTIVKNGTTLAFGSNGTSSARRGVAHLCYLAVSDSITIVAFAGASGVTGDAVVGMLYHGA